jgi:hypothetical protein
MARPASPDDVPQGVHPLRELLVPQRRERILSARIHADSEYPGTPAMRKRLMPRGEWRGEGEDAVSLHRLRQRHASMGGTVSGVQRVEHAGGGAGGPRPRPGAKVSVPGSVGSARPVASVTWRARRVSAGRPGWASSISCWAAGGTRIRRSGGWRAGDREIDDPAAGRRAAAGGREEGPSTSLGRSRRCRCACARIGWGRMRGGDGARRDGARRHPATRGGSEADVLLVDSIQTVYTPDLEGAPGNVGQVRECAARLQRFAKESGTAVFLVGSCHQGRRDRRSEDARAHRRHGALLRGCRDRSTTACCAPPRTASVESTRSASSR